MEKELIKIIKTLNKHKIEYLLIGGYAAVIYKVERATFDIDILIDTDNKKIKKVISLLSTLRFRPIQNEINSHYGIRFTDGKTKLDLMFMEPVIFNNIYRYHNNIKYRDTTIKLPNIMDLVNMKESSKRPRDIEDAVILRHIVQSKRK